jgi:riboflavin synthase alpha subunit
MKKTGDAVNLEFDIIGKYMARLDELKKGPITEEFLRQKGF